MAEKNRKTPEQRATEALGVGQRAVTKWDGKVEAAQQALAEARGELEKAVGRLRYLSIHPDLPETEAAKAKAQVAKYAQQGETVGRAQLD